MSDVVCARNLFKQFGEVYAMDDVSFNVPAGAIVGLIGPNGAGKTTTLKSLLGLSTFDGELSVLGMDPRDGRHHLMERVCFIADVGVLPKWLRVNEAIEYVAGVHARFDEKKAWAVLAETDIRSAARIGELSKGMITQLHLAIVMSNLA